ncbi:unnamed protein product [Cuscuta campestris]|uniref:7,8-dihydroneopterin aldolase n=1 Tax=Cuscuta campestris TaxID=132261 RepID=A0A484L5Y7_9ASTE|nr:unnamed protein product [Cuscuta campestris]
MDGGSKATGDALDRDISAASIPLPPSSLVVGRDEMSKGDKLVLRGLKFHGFHGVKAEERALGQKFVVDMDVWMDLRAAGKSDRLSDTLSYTDIYRIVKEVVEGSAHNLLESVAEHISSATLTRYAQVSAVRIQVGKPHVAVQGSLDYLGVEIVRYRGVYILSKAVRVGGI